ncbi:SDR family oxidoreductase [Streptococcus caviae]|uniref:SDR family oxidoreductase n=1 Tax=Streptococcus sp. 'caviae' TaxID=1915004 RepID=UPI00094B9366|nr:SDR family oxidoreductase [Streptococcus sp. 'caviae']OLN83998.1 NAD-dependent dehydratase [Streptococcus sp. 'caviae']
MKVFVAGATGRVAQRLIQNLAENHSVYAGARKPEKVIKHKNITAVPFDLHDDLPVLTERIKGMDAVYFTAGSRGQDLLQVDAFGAVKLAQAAEQAGIKRFILLSSMFALEPDKWHLPGLDKLTNYNIAKFFADNYVVHQTDLDYTIIQPTGLTEEAASGKIALNPAKPGTNSIADVAHVLAAVLERPNTYGKVIKMSAGDEVIETALESL